MIPKHEVVFLRDQIHNALRLISEYKYAQAIEIMQHVEISLTDKIKESNKGKKR